jgi:hypothetical protein
VGMSRSRTFNSGRRWGIDIRMGTVQMGNPGFTLWCNIQIRIRSLRGGMAAEAGMGSWRGCRGRGKVVSF